MWYVVVDPYEGPFLTQDKPQGDEGLEVVFEDEDQFQAECALSQECNHWEGDLDEDDDMNESFQ